MILLANFKHMPYISVLDLSNSIYEKKKMKKYIGGTDFHTIDDYLSCLQFIKSSIDYETNVFN